MRLQRSLVPRSPEIGITYLYSPPPVTGMNLIVDAFRSLGICVYPLRTKNKVMRE